jgi:hypothetical protein
LTTMPRDTPRPRFAKRTAAQRATISGRLGKSHLLRVPPFEKLAKSLLLVAYSLFADLSPTSDSCFLRALMKQIKQKRLMHATNITSAFVANQEWTIPDIQSR